MRSIRTGRLVGVLTTPLGSVGAALLATVVLLQGLAVPGVAHLAGLPALSLLSSSGPLGGLAPLSDEFVRRALGLPPLTQGDAASPSVPVASLRPAGTSPGRADRPDRPVVVAHPFDNDAFAAARIIPSVPYTATTDTRGQTRDPGEPTSCAPVGGTAWYRYTPPRDQALFADTFGTRYADSLGVFAGASLAELRPVTCTSSTSGATQTGFLARRGVTYWFQVAGPLGGGALTFHLFPVGTTDTLSTQALSGAVLSADRQTAAFVGFPQSAGGGAQVCASSSGVTTYCQALYVVDLATSQVRLVVSTHPEPTAFQSLRVDTVIKYLSVSSNGRYVSFTSDDSGLVPADTNLVWDVFVVDAATVHVERVSVASDGSQAAFDPTSRAIPAGAVDSAGTSPGSLGSTISADGRWVAFGSDADNLAPGDSGGSGDVFRHDRVTGRTTLVSVGSDGKHLLNSSCGIFDPQSMSADGSRVVFVRYTAKGKGRVWVFDARSRRSTELADPRFPTTGYVGISPDGSTVAYYFSSGDQQAGVVKVDVRDLRNPRSMVVVTKTQLPTRTGVNDLAFLPLVSKYTPALTLSRTGRYVAFTADAADLVPGDTNSASDVFVRDTVVGTTVRISLSSGGSEYTAASDFPFISSDGRDVLFGNNEGLLLHSSTSPGAP